MPALELKRVKLIDIRFHGFKQEEDLLEAESKLEKYENEMQIKTASMEELKQELAKVLQAQSQKSKIVTSLLSDTEPLKVL